MKADAQICLDGAAGCVRNEEKKTMHGYDYSYFWNTLENLKQIPQIRQMDQYIQHGQVTCLCHCIAVAYLSYRICRALRMRVDYDSLIRGAMLHDFFLYDWHDPDPSHKWHGFRHPFTAYRNASGLFRLTPIERDIICSHMWPLTLRHMPHHREAAVICLADKICSLRETVEGFVA